MLTLDNFHPTDAHAGFASGTELISELVVNNAIVGICFMANRRFLWVNPRMADIMGYDHGELDGRDVRELFVTDQEYREVGLVLEEQATLSLRYVHERQLRRKDGSQLWCLLSGRFLHPGDAERRAVWVVQDISQRHEAEQNLVALNQVLERQVAERTRSLQTANETLKREIEQRKRDQKLIQQGREKYRALFMNSPLGILVSDSTGQVVEANRALKNYLAVSTMARLRSLMQEPNRANHDGRQFSLGSLLSRLKTLPSQRGAPIEFSWTRDDGEQRNVTILASSMGHRQASTLYTLADVTEQRQALEREREQQLALAHSSRLTLMGQMASALAHELGQPLNACLGYVGGMNLRLAQGTAEKDDLEFALGKIEDSLQQAAAIVRNVRSFAKRQIIEHEDTDIQDLMENTLSLVSAQLRSAGVAVDMAFPVERPRIACNPVEVQQVLVNLIMNAIDALEDSPQAQRHIALHVDHERHEAVSITITDDGPGIGRRDQLRLFETYFSTKRDGLGMGLHIAKTIAEAHRGSLEFLGNAPGARFRFTLRSAR